MQLVERLDAQCRCVIVDVLHSGTVEMSKTLSLSLSSLLVIRCVE
jgi:hypothetical protein